MGILPGMHRQLLLLITAACLYAGEPAMTVVAARDASFYRHSEGSAIELPDGRIMLAWSRFAGKDGDDNGPSTMVAALSADRGKTWSAPVELPVGKAATNIMQAAFLPVKNGLTLVFSVRGAGKSVKHAIDSTDGGRTWGERRMLFDAGGPNDRAVRLKGGRILMPSHRVAKLKTGGYDDMEVLVARSDDEGRTWALSALVDHVKHAMELKEKNAKPLKIHEPAIAELADGRLLMLARSTAGWLYRSWSKDGGVTWSTFEQTDIPSFAAPPYLRKLADGRIALLWNPVAGAGAANVVKMQGLNLPVGYGPRIRLAMATSTDGLTWSEPRVLAEDGTNGFCYPAMLQLRGGQALVFCSRTPDIISPCDLVMIGPFAP